MGTEKQTIKNTWYVWTLFLSTLFWVILFFQQRDFPVIPDKNTMGVVLEKTGAFEGYYLWNCNLYDGNEMLLDLGGKYCRFLNDNRFVSYQDYNLRVLGPGKEILWEVPVISHHDLSIDEERNEIVVLITDKDEKKSTHYHGVRIYNKNGDSVFHWNTEMSLPELEKIVGKTTEEMHALSKSEIADRTDLADGLLKINSIQVIPPTPLYPELSFLKPGNIIMNLQRENLMFILDRETKKIVWHLIVPGRSHAGKINSKGNLIFFENRSGSQPKTHWEKFLKVSFYYPYIVLNERHEARIIHEPGKLRNVFYSTIFEYDIKNKKYIWSYKKPNHFYSAFLGYIQDLPNGNLLVTHVSRGGSVFEINQDKEIVWEWVNPLWYDELKGPHLVSQLIKVEKELAAPFLKENF